MILFAYQKPILNSSIAPDDARLSIDGYSLLRSVHQNNVKRRSVYLYFKYHISLVRRDDLSNLDECTVTKVKINGGKYFLTCLYRSPSQDLKIYASFNFKF